VDPIVLPGGRTVLFSCLTTLANTNYDVASDGRFLMLRRVTQGGTLRVVLNWTEELKRTLAKGGV
jgi:hypothetical protein